MKISVKGHHIIFRKPVLKRICFKSCIVLQIVLVRNKKKYFYNNAKNYLYFLYFSQK